MSALVITASQVLTGAEVGATFLQGIAGEAITAGEPLYLDAGTGTYKKATKLDGTKTDVKGIALHSASTGQPIRLQAGTGTVILGAGAAPAVGTLYCLGTAGDIIPHTDLGSQDYVVVLGIGQASNKLGTHIYNSGQQIP